jgi:uncharacterized repeat protein (TIGR01451 family)
MTPVFHTSPKTANGTIVPAAVVRPASAAWKTEALSANGRTGIMISRPVRLFAPIAGYFTGNGRKKAWPAAWLMILMMVFNLFQPLVLSAAVLRIENTAYATFGDGAVVPSNTVINSSSDGGVIDVGVQKSVDQAAPKEGETIEYTLRAVNISDYEAKNVQVTDSLPDGLSFVSAHTVKGKFSAGIWTVGTLSAKEAAVLTLQAFVNTGMGAKRITNTAVVTINGVADANTDNNVSSIDIFVKTSEARTPSVIEILKYAPGIDNAPGVPVSVTFYSSDCDENGLFVSMDGPVTVGAKTPISLDTDVPLIPSDLYHQGEPFFIRLTDRDQNLNSDIRETVIVRLSVSNTGDSETLRLTETGPDTGGFAGYIQSNGNRTGTKCDGLLSVTVESQVEARYEDAVDHSDVSITVVMVDPYGKVFETITGLPVNGAKVTLMDMATGQPAVVYGDDGVSRFPATLISGGLSAQGHTAAGVVRDDGGNVYDFPDGGFRFPLVMPGDYRLDVAPPDGYASPSVVSTAAIQTLPGAPFAIEIGSRGETFALNLGPAFHVDIPVDPMTSSLFLVKTAGKQTAAVGDFIPYTLELKNNADQTVTHGLISDLLPLGFDYQKGSLTIEGKRAADPEVTGKGRNLEIPVGELAPGMSVKVGYVVEVAAGTKTGKAVNQAVAWGDGGVASQPATASVEIREDLFRSRTIIMGRVIIDNCDDKKTEVADGLSDVKIYLEDGTFVLTDPEGKFHFEGVTPGTHVVQLDLETIPEKFEVIDCDKKGRFAGRAYSQFVDVQGGTMWRADFHVQLKPKTTGNVNLQMTSRLKPRGKVLTQAVVSGKSVPVQNIRLTALIPEGLEYIPGSSRVDDKPVLDPEGGSGAMTFRIGDAGSEFTRLVEFETRLTESPARELAMQALVTLNTPEQNNQRTPAVENIIQRSAPADVVQGVIVKGRADAQIETTGLRPGEIWKSPEIKTQKISADTFDQAYLETASPGVAWLWPENASVPPIPSVKVAIQHLPGQQLTLMLNGKPVSPLNFDTMMLNRAKTAAISRWRGVDVRDGNNQFELIVKDKQGREVTRLERMVHYSGLPVRAELIKEESVLVADGRTVPVIAVRFTDQAGYPAREGVVGEFVLKAPYLSEQEKKDLQKNPFSGRTEKIFQKDAFTDRTEKSRQKDSLTGGDGESLRFEVGEKGIAKIRLQPTATTGTAELEFPFLAKSQTVHAWLAPQQRDWILVGLAEGTMGYNAISGNMETLNAADAAKHLYDDGRVAFFAKGKVQGKWLMTMAYDTDRDKAAGKGLHRIIDPDTYYTLYGDATDQGYDAASTRKLYVKMERDQFYALFGDYDTALTVTELSRYDRTFNGVKSELQTDRYSLNVFVTDSGQLFIKDEIRGDGTSGLYHLSHASIAVNSEKIRIEIRDRFKSEVIVETRELQRHLDYNIDYDSGTLYFKRPVYSKDEDFNPIFIVADYEVENVTGENYYTYGGRGAVRFFDQALEIGATGIREDNGTTDGDLAGADATVKIGAGTEIKTEIAATQTSSLEVENSGTAKLVELNHMTENVDGKIYVREQDGEFGLGQQNVSESGTRKMGLEGIYRFTRTWSLEADTYRQDNLTDDARRYMAETIGHYEGEIYGMGAGLRHAEDHFSTADDEDQKADQIILGGSRNFLNKRLRLRVTQEQSIGNNSHEEFPTRSLVGADYKLTDAVSLFAEQEFTFSDTGDTQGARAGIDTTPWTGGRVGSSIGRDYQEDGARLYANMGLGQTWQINDRWSVDGGIDQSRTLDGEPVREFDEDTAPAFGTEDDQDFTALSLGTLYRRERWSWDWRGEFRHSDSEDKQGMLTGVYGEPRPGIGLSAALQWFDTNGDAGRDETSADLRFGFAYRPKNTFWMLLDRLDLIQEEAAESGDMLKSRRIVNNANLHIMPADAWQISLQYGAKYVRDTIDSRDYTGYTDLSGLETRYNITRRWDVGLHGGVLHSWNADIYDYTAGASVGCTLMTNAWASLGYNFIGFADRDFSIVNFTAKGPFIKLRIKMDQKSAKDAVEWFTKR